jgi:hypothetical protein
MYYLDEFHGVKFNLFAYIKTGLHLPNSADTLNLLSNTLNLRRAI